MKNLLPFLLYQLFFLQPMAKKCFLTDKFQVHVVNALPPNSLPLLTHCASGDNDLGNQMLSHPNQEFHWSFCESILHNTLFFCTVSWGPKHSSFIAYKSGWNSKCPSFVCSFAAKTDGIYFSGEIPVALNKILSWEG
ncbi:hypothetical protein CDL12_05077 [Handroanthus impetiginosus]|uniref:S-protein homolog n=1 Tax=Handroanthus impetiginosus TaxID=429701 RepID=A0A2G9HXF8_9LAMI|nr:hypothetical protein CDL12_05077 [Handroanthus impetiginosus]